MKLTLAHFARGLFVLLATRITALAQAPATPSAATPATPPPQGAASGIATVGALVAVLALIVLVVKLYDLKRKREDEALAVEARISDALLVHPSMAGLPIAASVHVSLFGRSTSVVELSGSVPSNDLRDLAVEVVSRELAGSGADLRVEDRLVVDPAMFERLASAAH